MRSLSLLTMVLSSVLLASSTRAGEGDLPIDQASRISYSLGYQMGMDFKRQGVSLDRNPLIRGLHDGHSESEPPISRDEMKAVLTELKRKVMAETRSRKRGRAEKMRRAGLAFLEQNKGKEGARTTASGLQYKVLEAGSGKSPGPGDTVTVQYRGTLITGQEFDSSYKRGKPATLQLDKVIKGWAEGLQLMKEGAKYEFYIPPELAYDKKGPLADQTLIFEVELLAVNPDEPAQAGKSSE